MKLFNYRSWDTNAAALLLRLIFGGLFIYHGWQKIQGYDMFVSKFPDLIGIGGKLSFHLVIFAEFVCGILVTIGLFTRLAVLPILITMIVAYFKAHAGAAFAVKELAFVFLLLSIVILILGPGKYSVDGMIYKDRKGTFM